jgi:archaellum component FlaF (FlaF/FlaG flagellin family)
MINSIVVEEELEAAQSKASNKDVNLFRLGSGQASRSKVVISYFGRFVKILCRCGSHSFLFPLNHYLIKPNSSACTRPLRIRHKSTASCRASATMAFLRAARVVRTPLAKSTFHFFTGR